MKFSWTRAKPVGERIISVEVKKDGGWAPIDPDAIYGVVTNNYMRAGGDGYKIFETNGVNAYDYGPNLEDVLADYISMHPDFKAVLDGRITEVK